MDNIICIDRCTSVSSGSLEGPVGSCYDHNNDSSSPTTLGYFFDLPIAHHCLWTQLHGVSQWFNKLSHYNPVHLCIALTYASSYRKFSTRMN